jgi:hypothetical protein
MPRGKKFTADQIIGKLRQAAEAIATTETWGRSVRQPPTSEGVVFLRGSAWLLTVNRADGLGRSAGHLLSSPTPFPHQR